MSFEIKGIVHKVFDTESKTATFQAREFVIKTVDGSYEQFIKFQLTQDRCSLIDGYNEGDEINVHFDLRGREWQDKYFTNLNAWRIERVSDQPAAPASGPEQPVDFLETNDSSGDMKAEDFDDLPF